MAALAVVYHSKDGHTKIMAEGVCAGASSVAGVETELFVVEAKQIIEGRWKNDAMLSALDGVDAIVFGCPTYMGNISGAFKLFLDATLQRWSSRAWVDKVAAGFTVSSTPGGDKQNTLVSLATCAMQLGMIWVGLEQIPLNPKELNRLSFYLGAAGQAQYGGSEASLYPGDRETGALLGQRVARIARTLEVGRQG